MTNTAPRGKTEAENPHVRFFRRLMALVMTLVCGMCAYGEKIADVAFYPFKDGTVGERAVTVLNAFDASSCIGGAWKNGVGDRVSPLFSDDRPTTRTSGSSLRRC